VPFDVPAIPHRRRSTIPSDALAGLIDTLRYLRGENGCPWDRKQTLVDFCRYLIDEAYELQEAVLDAEAVTDHAPRVHDELGDVLFVALSCALSLEEASGVGLDQVAQQANDKIVRRHPHVFGGRTAASPEESLQHWRDVKAQEARERGETPQSLLDGIPRTLPAIRRALTVQRKVGAVGFEWETAAQVYAKFLEEARELRDVLPSQDAARIREELGDMLFSVINLARFVGVDAEAALHTTTSKFVRRFQFVERELASRGVTPEQASLQEMDGLWERAKREMPDAGGGA
jgi:MazG family protein